MHFEVHKHTQLYLQHILSGTLKVLDCADEMKLHFINPLQILSHPICSSYAEIFWK